MKIKNWFLNKNFEADEQYAIAEIEPTVEKETEKAMLLKWHTQYGTITRWVPKSCIEAEPVVTDQMKEQCRKLAAAQKEKESTFVKGAKVKNINGRKIFTIISNQISYGKVMLDNGKYVSIDKLVLVG